MVPILFSPVNVQCLAARWLSSPYNSLVMRCLALIVTFKPMWIYQCEQRSLNPPCLRHLSLVQCICSYSCDVLDQPAELFPMQLWLWPAVVTTKTRLQHYYFLHGFSQGFYYFPRLSQKENSSHMTVEDGGNGHCCHEWEQNEKDRPAYLPAFAQLSALLHMNVTFPIFSVLMVFHDTRISSYASLKMMT